MRIHAPLASTLLAGFGLALFASPGSAQVTHDVLVDGFSFTPANSTIDVGDTVRWTWGLGLHDVESGMGGVPDFIFDSGVPVLGPLVFEVTFDAAFLAANPVAGDLYDYYCTIHVPFGMFGSVQVNSGPTITPYGCLNPTGSLVELGGSPVIGTTWTVGVDNPIPGGQPAGSLAFLNISLLPQIGFPCGIPLAGWNMDPAAPFGELLINVAPPDPVLSLGPLPWAGTGSPAAFAIPIPATAGLVGIPIHLQGILFDITGANTFGASEGWQTVIG